MRVEPLAPISRTLALVLAIVPVAAASIIGSAATLPNIPNWYMGLTKPDFTPPNWIFGPVWTTLYILIAIACFRVLRKPRAGGYRGPIIAYLVQAFFNGAWSVSFFGMNNPGLGLIVIVPLWVSILWTLILFWKEDRLAGGIFVPYLAWVSFAIALNAGVWLLNA